MEIQDGRAEIVKIVKAYFKALSGNNLDAMVKYHADIFVSENMTALASTKPIQSRDEMREWLALFQTGFPDKSFKPERIMVDGNRATVQWRIQGKNTGPFRGLREATNKEINISGVSVIEIKSGRIVSEVSYWDTSLLMQQVGLMPKFGQEMGK